MWCYYCDEDRARLSGGIGYVGHHGGGQIKHYQYPEFVQQVIYPYVANFTSSQFNYNAFIFFYILCEATKEGKC